MPEAFLNEFAGNPCGDLALVLRELLLVRRTQQRTWPGDQPAVESDRQLDPARPQATDEYSGRERPRPRLLNG